MIIVKSYSELEEFYRAFSKGNINLLIIESDGGLGKTSTAEAILKGAMFIRGHATPLSIYLKVHDLNPELIVFDDVETLLKNKINTTLLKQICDTKPVKTVNYHTTATIDGKAVPRSIETTAKVIILTNDLKRTGKNLEALLGRGHVVHFKPDHNEILLKIALFDEVDDEVLGAIEKDESLIQNLNLRTYFKAKELKDSEMDWRKYLYAMCDLNDDVAVFKLIEEESLGLNVSVESKIVEFIKQTGKSERTYYSIKKKLQN